MTDNSLKKTQHQIKRSKPQYLHPFSQQLSTQLILLSILLWISISVQLYLSERFNSPGAVIGFTYLIYIAMVLDLHRRQKYNQFDTVKPLKSYKVAYEQIEKDSTFVGFENECYKYKFCGIKLNKLPKLIKYIAPKQCETTIGVQLKDIPNSSPFIIAYYEGKGICKSAVDLQIENMRYDQFKNQNQRQYINDKKMSQCVLYCKYGVSQGRLLKDVYYMSLLMGLSFIYVPITQIYLISRFKFSIQKKISY